MTTPAATLRCAHGSRTPARRCIACPATTTIRRMCSASSAAEPFVHEFATSYGAWVVVMMNSTVAGANHGHFGAEELARLDAALAAKAGVHALICLHHHPVPHGSAWLDELMLDNAAEFFAVLARHAGVRGLAWGHTHQPFEGMHGQIRLMGTPSTCMQFAQNADEFEVDSRPPGYRWLELGDDGGIETEVEWVDDRCLSLRCVALRRRPRSRPSHPVLRGPSPRCGR